VRFGALELAAPADFSPRGQVPPSALGARALKIYTLIVRQWKSSISRCSKGKPMLDDLTVKRLHVIEKGETERGERN